MRWVIFVGVAEPLLVRQGLLSFQYLVPSL
jgi:hypothetical protein